MKMASSLFQIILTLLTEYGCSVNCENDINGDGS